MFLYETNRFVHYHSRLDSVNHFKSRWLEGKVISPGQSSPAKTEPYPEELTDALLARHRDRWWAETFLLTSTDVDLSERTEVGQPSVREPGTRFDAHGDDEVTSIVRRHRHTANIAIFGSSTGPRFLVTM